MDTLTEALTTLCTQMWLFHLLDLFMLDQGGALGEALLTLRADIKLLTCMCALVLEKLTTGWEILLTLRTGTLVVMAASCSP